MVMQRQRAELFGPTAKQRISAGDDHSVGVHIRRSLEGPLRASRTQPVLNDSQAAARALGLQFHTFDYGVGVLTALALGGALLYLRRKM